MTAMAARDTSSADNTLMLVVALRERGSLRVADAARLLSVTPPTAHRLLSTLKRHQFAEQDRSRVYLPGPRMREQSEHLSTGHVGTSSHRLLTALAESSGETVHLMTLEGNGSRVVDEVDSGNAPRARSRLGLLLPAHCTSGGKVLLAQLPETELLALYPDGRVRMRDGVDRDLTSLCRELATVRRQGFALDLECSDRGVAAVGVPVPCAGGRVTASLVVAGPVARTSRRRLIDLVPSMRTTALCIARGASRTRSSATP